MNAHPTPMDSKFHVLAALMNASQRWEAETGQTFPYIAAADAVNEGFSNSIAEREAMKARLHNTRAA